MKNTSLILSLLGFILLAFSGCSKENNDPSNGGGDLSTTKSMLAFKFEKTYNPQLHSDITASISSIIQINIPEGIDLKNLIATFSHNGKTVFINGVKQVSGSSRNDFSKSVTYQIEAEDGSIREYDVNINTVRDTGKEILAFSFEAKLNPVLTTDLHLKIDGTAITGALGRVDNKSLVATFKTSAKSVTVNGTTQESGKTVNDFSKPIVYVVTSEWGNETRYTVTISWEGNIPHLYIETAGNAAISAKDVYVKGKLTINGKGIYPDYSGSMSIRGRGNSTWGMPKKPYRIKLDQKTELLGLDNDSDWILLANYIDPTLMLNAVAMKIGRLLDVPYTNHMIPVDVTLNGSYIGNYMFTEQIEISKGRVNIDDVNGALLELDTNYDETYQFHSNRYSLPIMVKEPALLSDAQFQKIKGDFHQMENKVYAADFPNNDYLNDIDANALVGYLITFNLTHNMEINHPKSVYMSKDANGKYVMGPLWDFDWGFNYEGSGTHFNSYTNPVFASWGKGGAFFTRFLQDPVIKNLYKTKWNEFKSTKLDKLYIYIDEYAESIAESQVANFKRWPNGKNFNTELGRLKTWLRGRVAYMDGYVNSL